MKKLILTALVFNLCFAVIAQQNGKVVFPGLKDLAVKKSISQNQERNTVCFLKPANHTVKSTLTSDETTIGTTWYDYQTNGSTPQRIYLYSADGSIGASWAYGVGSPTYADRGTGYNYFDGSVWGAVPTARIEDIKTGAPCYAPWESTGEIVVSHTNTASGVKIATRTTKGSGTWTLNTKAGPAGHENILWPRVQTTGPASQYIHLFALTAPIANGGTPYKGQDGALLYSRSNDGGNTWSINNVVIPGTDSSNYLAFNAESYAFAKPIGTTLAFVYGNVWSDVFLLKSTDNGNNWTKTTIFHHPYQKFKESTTLVTDTPYVCDNSLAIALDNTGKAYVFFGIQKVRNDILNDSSYSWFPYTDGLAYWKEGQPAFTSLNPVNLATSGHLVGWTQDVNGNGIVEEFIASPSIYNTCSVTSMPTVTIDQTNNRIYLFFTSVVEGLTNTFQNYRHIYSRRSDDGGTSWTAFNDITGAAVHHGDECVFPSVSPTSDPYYCHLVYQKDQEPGMSFDGDLDPAGSNDIVYLKFPKNTTGIGELIPDIASASIFPNPVHGMSQIDFILAKTQMLSLDVTDILGRIIYQVPAAMYTMGNHKITVDASSWLPGLYICTLKGPDQSLSQRMIVR